MDFSAWIEGTQVGVEEMATARELRQHRQQHLLQVYGATVVSFTLNIMGAVKVFPLSALTYQEGKQLIAHQCVAHGLGIVHRQETLANTGYECLFVVEGSAKAVKQALCQLEETCSLGRLFDIDVMQEDGQKIARQDLGLPGRTCLLCGNDVFVCSRSRAHTTQDLLQRSCELMWGYFSVQYVQKIGRFAISALLREVMVTPKPGLVDQDNTGAHKDMDVTTFEASALALLPHFQGFVRHGIDHGMDAPDQVFSSLRPLGMAAEVAMRQATGGVNTHKGAIFSMGILCCGLGMLYAKQTPYSWQELEKICRELCAPLQGDFPAIEHRGAQSHGELLYLHHGLRGVRGQAIDGFPQLFHLAYPRFATLRNKGLSMNDAGVITLVDIIAHTQDTNVVIRSDYQTMWAVAEQCKALENLENQDYFTIVKDLDVQFIKQNISPGGSADLLALTYFLHFLETDKHKD